MLRPVGTRPSSVYWRRRLLVLGALVVLVVLLALTVQALTSDSGNVTHANAAGTTAGNHSSTKPVSTPPPTRTTQVAGQSTGVRRTTQGTHRRTKQGARRKNRTAAQPGGSGSGSSTTSTTSTASTASTSASPPQPCQSADLHLAAATDHTRYKLGASPLLELEVTNVGTDPCVQDLAAAQVVLQVYNGESRVWNSHDCGPQSKVTDDKTLIVGKTVRLTTTWTGLSSEPGCAGTRQRAGAGAYTLYASLSGHPGTATRFSLT